MFRRAHFCSQPGQARRPGHLAPTCLSFQVLLYPVGQLQVHLCPRSHQIMVCYPQMGQHEQFGYLRGILLEFEVAVLHIHKMALEQPKRMLRPRPNAELELPWP